MAEAEDLKSSQCGFDPHSGHQFTGVIKAERVDSHGLGRFLTVELRCTTTVGDSRGRQEGEKRYAQFKPCFRTGV